MALSYSNQGENIIGTDEIIDFFCSVFHRGSIGRRLETCYDIEAIEANFLLRVRALDYFEVLLPLVSSPFL